MEGWEIFFQIVTVLVIPAAGGAAAWIKQLYDRISKLQESHNSAVQSLQEAHQGRVEEMQTDHNEQITTLQGARITDLRETLMNWGSPVETEKEISATFSFYTQRGATHG